MKAVAFLRSEAVGRVLERASRASGMPAAIHHVDDAAHEGPKLAGAGHCAACTYVAKHPGGASACKAARTRNSQYALKVSKPATFLCHMGFACVSAPALPSADQGFVLTMGPYCPAEAPELLMTDAMRGLVALGHAEMPFFPTPLTDINHLRSENVPALAEWTVDALDTLWRSETEALSRHKGADQNGYPQLSDEPPTSGAERPVRGRPRRLRSKLPDTSPYRGAEIAAALASGDQTLARTLVKTAIAELDAPGERQLAARRARSIAIAGATLEAAERAGNDAMRAWDQFGAFVNAVQQAPADTDLVKSAMALFSPLVPRRKTDKSDNILTELDSIVMGRMPEPVQLGEIAQRLGKHPTAITHHLQRKYGISFSQYVARLRINKAKELLRRTRLGIGEVATRVGISDQSNFTKQFRKFEGLSPLQYREQYRSHS
ncbi:MAG: helix-turn-helix domain-containing protein [Candidatus Hydrogenedentes bacterium]|nr:helix-turn-helix domain-containing protein [Candidatus Hydrogenedentota bacterium]